jgi:hypothetical protein
MELDRADKAQVRVAEKAADKGVGRVVAEGAVPGGNCVCPDCGQKVPHQMGTPCYDQQCPKCGSAMMRE